MNTYLTTTCFLAFAAVTSAYPPGALPLAHVATIEERVPHYQFDYAVNDPSTGDNKAQWEKRLGDTVHGAYTLLEPDGNRRLVEYTADPMHGFNAVVKRTGPQIHSITPVMTKVAPIAHIAPVAQVEHIAPIAPIVEHVVDYAPAHITPVIPEPVITPIIETEPVVVPEHHIVPIMPVHSSPWVTLSGTTYGHKGIVRRWAAGPISLDGKTLTIRTKHH